MVVKLIGCVVRHISNNTTVPTTEYTFVTDKKAVTFNGEESEKVVCIKVRHRHDRGVTSSRFITLTPNAIGTGDSKVVRITTVPSEIKSAVFDLLCCEVM